MPNDRPVEQHGEYKRLVEENRKLRESLAVIQNLLAKAADLSSHPDTISAVYANMLGALKEARRVLGETEFEK